MLAFFFSIVILTAGLAYGMLFYIMPENIHPQVKGAHAVAVSPTLTPTIEVSVIPTERIIGLETPSPEITQENASAKQITEQNTPTPKVLIVLSPTVSHLPTITSTNTPTPNPTYIPSPTIVEPTPTSVSIPTPTEYLEKATNTSPQGLNADVIFALINNHRSSLGLPLFQKDATTCSIAQQRAPQVYNEIFTTHNMHAGFNAMHFAYWITENIISIDTEQAAVDWWLQDTIHRQGIEGNYKYSCVACSGNACAQILTSYIPK